MLMVLIEARGSVVSKEALMARVWPDRVVEENALDIDKALYRGNCARQRASPGCAATRAASGRHAISWRRYMAAFTEGFALLIFCRQRC